MLINKDERDTIFSRLFELKPGTEKYSLYYKDKPELEKADIELRNHCKGEFSSDILNQRLVDSTFGLLKDMRPLAHKIDINKSKVDVTPSEISEVLKKLAKSYGAVLTGVAIMKPELYYSYRGRGNKYGEKCSDNNPYSFTFAVEMNRDELLNAPNAKESVEVVRGYSRVALIGMIISYYIRNLGYTAYCHMDGETTVPLVPVAYQAGLGEIGRMGLIINKEYGARLRLGAVTTNIPLVPDAPVDFGLQKVCEKCKKCSLACPGEAIDKCAKGPWNEVNDINCFKQWRKLGTDCGICLVTCPYSK